jgi:hypothetical protein
LVVCVSRVSDLNQVISRKVGDRVSLRLFVFGPGVFILFLGTLIAEWLPPYGNQSQPPQRQTLSGTGSITPQWRLHLPFSALKGGNNAAMYPKARRSVGHLRGARGLSGCAAEQGVALHRRAAIIGICRRNGTSSCVPGRRSPGSCIPGRMSPGICKPGRMSSCIRI